MAASERASAEMRGLIERLKISPASLDVSGLKKSSEQQFLSRTAKSAVERFVLRTEGAYDAFTYYVYLDKAKKEFWVFRAGGNDPVQEWYGPGKLPLPNPSERENRGRERRP